MMTKRLGDKDTLITSGLFVATFLALLATERAVGFTRDESMYFWAAERYLSWFKLLFRSPTLALTDAAIVARWDYNHEHPVLMKSLFAGSFWLFHEVLEWVRPATAFRLPAFAVAALIPPLLFRLGLQLFGRTAGLLAGLSFFLVPRQFFHAHLACFDVPVAAMWLLVVYAYYRAPVNRRAWVYTGLAFGLALATKHNAFFIPLVLAPFALYRVARLGPPERRHAIHFLWASAALPVLYGVMLLSLGPSTFQARFVFLSPHTAVYLAWVVGAGVLLRRLRGVSHEGFSALAPLYAMGTLGPLVLYLHWPYVWHAPVDRIAWWLNFHAQHNHYTWFYLGELLREPPFPLAYVVVVTALTVPLSLLVPMALGVGAPVARTIAALAWRRGGERALPSWREVLLLVNALFSIALISNPDVPHFGGVKHWFPSMVFLALLLGDVLAKASTSLGALLRGRLVRLRPAAPWVLGALVFAPAAIATSRVYAYGTSAYAELAGGLPGAASLGMQRQFWSNNVTGVLPWLNEHAPLGARVYLHEVISFGDYQRNGMLRSDLVEVRGPEQADFAAYQYHHEFREHEFAIWEAFGTTTPVYGLYVDETPQVIVYRRARP